MFLTNNISENINSILNSFFKKKYPLFTEWREAILNIVDMFENKKFEITRKNKSSNLMIYYIKNINLDNKNLHLLKTEDIKRLKSLDDLKQNALSVSGISNILNISDEKDNISIDLKAEEESQSDKDESEIDDINNMVGNINLSDMNNSDDYKFYLSQILKDIDLDQVNNEIINKIIK